MALAATTCVVLLLWFVAACAAPQAPVTQSGASQASAVEMCADCNGKGSPPKAQGTATAENGVQVLRVGVKDGYYAPNALEAKAGEPIRILFAGTAKGCLAKPKFPALGKKADFSAGTATLDLGALPAGTYSFTCAMGKNAGTLLVR